MNQILTDEEIIDLFPDTDDGDGDIQYGLAIEQAILNKLSEQKPSVPEGYQLVPIEPTKYTPHFVGHVDELFDEAVIYHAEFSRTDLVFLAAARSE